MYVSKLLMEALPNIHLIGVIIVAVTVVYRAKALFAVYSFVFITGLFNGFNTWWVPYLYVWTVLWMFAMLIPKRTPKWLAPILYMIVCSLHGFLYGTLYAPFQAIVFGLDFNGMLTWIASGFYFDLIHGISNFLCGVLIYPMVQLLRKCEKMTSRS